MILSIGGKELKRSELKSVVKECLLEILVEGLATNSSKRVTKEVVEQPRRRATDHILTSNQQRPAQSRQNDTQQRAKQQMTSKIVESIVPNDPVMASIFEDTASTTLREQVAADSGRSTSFNDTGTDPTTLFDGADNWAALAFASPTTNRGGA